VSARRDEGLGDGRPLASDDRELRRAARARERVYRNAYAEGYAGAPWDAEAWPEGDDVRDAYDAGVSDRRRDRRANRRAAMVGGLAWLARHLAPRSTRRVRRLHRRVRRARAALEGHR